LREQTTPTEGAPKALKTKYRLPGRVFEGKVLRLVCPFYVDESEQALPWSEPAIRSALRAVILIVLGGVSEQRVARLLCSLCRGKIYTSSVRGGASLASNLFTTSSFSSDRGQE
ncbi:MAG: hypothetical protein ACREYF_25575, partial [Gammaproteobacteria bacterium]